MKFITALHYNRQSLDRWRIYIPDRTAGIHYYQRGGQLYIKAVVMFLTCVMKSPLDGC